MSNVYNSDLFAGVLSECVRIGEIFCDSLFVNILKADNSQTLVFSKKFILELLTAFGLFDHFDYKHLFAGDAKCIEDMARNMGRLRAMNRKLFEHVKCDESLLEYQFGLLNLDMDFDAANRCFVANASKILEKIDFDYAKLGSFIFKSDAVSNKIINNLMTLSFKGNCLFPGEFNKIDRNLLLFENIRPSKR